MDLPDAAENLEALRKRFPDVEVVGVSAAKSEGLTELKDHLKEWLFTGESAEVNTSRVAVSE
jgi:selenocysteine-specific translation elongation factor